MEGPKMHALRVSWSEISCFVDCLICLQRPVSLSHSQSAVQFATMLNYHLFSSHLDREIAFLVIRYRSSHEAHA